MTSTATSRPAASTSVSLWGIADGARRGCGERIWSAGSTTRAQARAGPPRDAAARAPDPDDRDAVPARVRCGDGLQRVIADRGADRRRERDRPVPALPDLRRGGPRGDACARAPRGGVAQQTAGEHDAARIVRAARARDAPGLRRAGPWSPAVVLCRTDPVPAVGGDEAGARLVRGAVPGRASQAHAELPPGRWADRRPSWVPHAC